MFFPAMPPSIFATPHQQQQSAMNSTWPSGYRLDPNINLFTTGYGNQPSTSNSSAQDTSHTTSGGGTAAVSSEQQTLSQLLFVTQMLYHQQQSLQAQVQQLCLMVQQLAQQQQGSQQQSTPSPFGLHPPPFATQPTHMHASSSASKKPQQSQSSTADEASNAPATARSVPPIQVPLSPPHRTEQPSPLPGGKVNLSHDSTMSRGAHTPPRTPEPTAPRTPVEHYTSPPPAEPPRRSPSKPYDVQAHARDHAPLSYPPPQVSLLHSDAVPPLEVQNYSRSSSTGSSRDRPQGGRPTTTSLYGTTTTGGSHNASSDTAATGRWYDDRAVQSLLNRRITPVHGSDVSHSHHTSMSSVRGTPGRDSNSAAAGTKRVVPSSSHRASFVSRHDTSDDGYVSMESMQYMRQVGLL